MWLRDSHAGTVSPLRCSSPDRALRSLSRAVPAVRVWSERVGTVLYGGEEWHGVISNASIASVRAVWPCAADARSIRSKLTLTAHRRCCPFPFPSRRPGSGASVMVLPM